MATIVFDFDGTLHDSMHIYRIALRRGYAWLVEQGEAPARELTDADLAANIGLTAKEAWERMCPDIPWSVSRHAANRVGQIMHELMRDGTARLFPDVPEMLTQVKDAGHTLVFLSNCSTEYLAAARFAFELDQWFARYYAAEQFDWAPKEQIFETIRRDVAGPYIAVGDRYKDLALARAHELLSIGCTFGYGSEKELSDATRLARAVLEIPLLIEELAATMT